MSESSRREGVRLGMQTREEIVDGEKFIQGKGRWGSRAHTGPTIDKINKV